MTKVAVILSGCGNRDGSELQETLSLLLALNRRNIAYQCFAPKGELAVVSYINNDGETGEHRDIYAEAARIARGDLKPMTDYNVADYDALALPGGMGSVRNLSTYAFESVKMQVLPDVERAILDTHKAGKPICAMCIAPLVLAKVLGPYGVKITFGDPCQASKVAQQLGATHENCNGTGVCIDSVNRVLTTPAYMVCTRISQIFDGADNMISKLVEWL